MLILLEKAYVWYELINKRIRNDPNGKIIILVSHNIDSLTSLRILVGLFKSDVIPYEIIPVQNYDEVDKEIINCQKMKDEIKGFVFINCIGEIDLTKYWFYQEKEIISLITDTKRPIHHLNLRNSNIVIIDDGNNNIGCCPTEKEMEIVRQKVINVEDEENKKKLENNNEKNEEDEKKEDEDKNEEEGENVYKIDDNEDDEEKEQKEKENEGGNENDGENEGSISDENNKKIGGKIKKKIIKKRTDIDDEDFIDLKNESSSSIKEVDPLDEYAEEASVHGEKKSLNDKVDNENEEQEENDNDSQEKKINEKIKEIEKANLKVNEYYGGSYYGLPSTYIYYSIAHQLHKENISYLWYLIISITDEYLRYHISDKKYDKIYAICQSEVLRIEKKKSKDDDTLKIYKSTAKDGKSILIGSDYKLILYRHWNLYDSFIYSSYPLGVLSTWKEPGKGEVQKIFAYMGIPLNEAKQKYRYMKNEYLDTFKDKIIDVSKKFFLNEIIFHSFIYQFDNNTEMSASDCVYLLSCLMEFPFEEFNDIEIEDDEYLDENNSNISNDYIEKNNENDEGNKAQKENEDNEKSIINKKNKKKENIEKKFWMAYRFLSLKKLNMTNGLIDIAIKFQIALTNNATSILDKNGVKNEQKFRYSIVSTNLSEDSRYFLYPGNLERLCIVISETYKQLRGKKAENKPYLLAYIDAENKTYIIDGNLGCNKKDEEEKNTFPIQFKYVAKKLKIPVSYNYSTEEIITIKKDDLYSFINEITQL